MTNTEIFVLYTNYFFYRKVLNRHDDDSEFGLTKKIGTTTTANAALIISSHIYCGCPLFWYIGTFGMLTALLFGGIICC